MKIKLIIIGFILSRMAFSQVVIYEDTISKTFGLKNRVTNNLILPAIYKQIRGIGGYCFKYTNDIIPEREAASIGKWGLLDSNGKVLTPPVYRYISEISKAGTFFGAHINENNKDINSSTVKLKLFNLKGEVFFGPNSFCTLPGENLNYSNPDNLYLAGNSTDGYFIYKSTEKLSNKRMERIEEKMFWGCYFVRENDSSFYFVRSGKIHEKPFKNYAYYGFTYSDLFFCALDYNGQLFNYDYKTSKFILAKSGIVDICRSIRGSESDGQYVYIELIGKPNAAKPKGEKNLKPIYNKIYNVRGRSDNFVYALRKNKTIVFVTSAGTELISSSEKYSDEDFNKAYYTLMEMADGGKGKVANLNCDGEWEWYKNESLIKKGTYKNGIMTGEWKIYEKGKLKGTENYINGNKEGIWKTFNADGITESEKVYKNDTLISERSKSQSGQWLNGKRTGMWEWLDGTRKMEDNYRNDSILSRKTFEYFSDVNPETGDEIVTSKLKTRDFSIAHYYGESEPNFQKQGEQTAYHPNGRILSKEQYVDGLRQGDCIFYHENGNVSGKEFYAEGNKEGEFTYYYESGKIESFKTYKKDSLIECKFITEKGAERFFDSNSIDEGMHLCIYNLQKQKCESGAIYKEVKLYEEKYMTCKLADTVMKGNCTLLDKNLKTIIPYGLFSEIILTSDLNYAAVAGDVYNRRINYRYNDTSTTERETKNWGIYDIKNNKLTVPLKYSSLSFINGNKSAVASDFSIFKDNWAVNNIGQFMIINLKDEIISPAKYEYIGPYNNSGITFAEVINEESRNGSTSFFIAIDLQGKNIKPQFELNLDPKILEIRIKNGEKLTSDSLAIRELSALGFTKKDLTGNVDSILKSRYLVEMRTDEDPYTDYSTMVDKYCIYERESKIDLNKVLPDNIKFNYSPYGKISNWGKQAQYRINFPAPKYRIFTSSKLPTAAFFSVDSIYAGQFTDTLSIDYEYPGIFSQQPKLLGKKFKTDIQSRAPFQLNLEERGFIFNETNFDSLNYIYKAPCDTVFKKRMLGKNGDDHISTLWHYYKNFGLLVNDTVQLPPIYKFIIPFGADQCILVDSNYKVWRYNLTGRTLVKTDQIFVKLIHKKRNIEEIKRSEPKLLVLQNPSKKQSVYNIETGKLITEKADSLMNFSPVMFVDENGNEREVMVFSTGAYPENDVAVFMDSEIYSNGLSSELLTPYTPTDHVAYAPSVITIKGIKYTKQYTFRPAIYGSLEYFISTDGKQYKYWGGSEELSTNSIKIDSVLKMTNHLIYYSGNKMYIAGIQKKDYYLDKKGRNTDKVRKDHLIIKVDSAKKIIPFNDELYIADGVYKTYSENKKIIYTPSNFKELPQNSVYLMYEDQEKGFLRPRQLYKMESGGKVYLMKLEKPRVQNGINEVGEEFINGYLDQQLITVDSAKQIVTCLIKDTDDAFAKAPGVYIADGIIKSGSSYMPLPVQNMDTAIVISTKGQYYLEAFAILKDKKWKVLVFSSADPKKFKVLNDFTYNSYHELKKELYPRSLFSEECDRAVTPAKKYRLILAELAEKVDNGKEW